MIDQLIKLVQQNAGDAIIKNQAVPLQFKNEAVQEAGQQIFNGLQSQVKQGNLQGLMGLLKGGNNVSSLASHPIVTQIISSIAGKFASKFGIPQHTAQQIASGLVPKVISQFVSRTNDPNDKDFDLQDVVRNLGGGGLDVGDLLGQFGGSKNEGGGVGGMIGGFFK